ncbi:CotH kinase family protein [Seonamhaeicola sp. MEBiC1930]|uniref:CotH kinase family protein n=1 Tax=Seonamhaeicola sp. MEBiC01930 TaxID=2976768 RepID=UPI003244B93C
MKKTKQKSLLILTILFFCISTLTFYDCSGDTVISEVVNEDGDDNNDDDDDDEVLIDDTDFVPTDWTADTHSKDAEPNFDKIFPDDEVQRLDIVISEDNWDVMIDDMTSLYGAFGSRSGSNNFSDENPVFVPASVFHNNIEWYKVGVRFKGNSSLASSWRSGIMKLSFKLDFDEFEDNYPQIDNQRFYGFKKLSLKNNYDDDSQLREKAAAEVFRNAGLAVSHTAFYQVYVDNGDGPEYFGLYTLVEEVDDTVIETQFSSDEGNLYKPDGDAASFASGTYDEDEFEKKTNEDEADFSDVASLLSILHDGSRTSDPESWRNNLDAIFDTDVFLKYLAVNTVIQNWDTYGRMTHNYYLYNNPDTGKLTWIPWDNNESLQYGKMGGSLSLDFSGLSSSSWPIIGYIYQDEVYKARYDTYVQEVVDGAFNVSTMQALYTTYSSLVESYATTEVSGYSFLSASSDFYSAVSTLKSHVSSRASAVSNYLD